MTVRVYCVPYRPMFLCCHMRNQRWWWWWLRTISSDASRPTLLNTEIITVASPSFSQLYSRPGVAKAAYLRRLFSVVHYHDMHVCNWPLNWRCRTYTGSPPPQKNLCDYPVLCQILNNWYLTKIRTMLSLGYLYNYPNTFSEDGILCFKYQILSESLNNLITTKHDKYTSTSSYSCNKWFVSHEGITKRKTIVNDYENKR